MTQCNTKTRLDFHPDLPVDVTFDAPDISSDGGLTLLGLVDRQLGLTEAIAEVMPDDREAAKVQHSRHEQVRQRVFQLAMDYEDCVDADWLRDDRMFKTACGRTPDDEALSSQPTLSLFENAVDMRAICRMLFVLEWSWIRSLDETREVVVLDVDSSAFETHGQQKLVSYDGYREADIYHPLAVFDGQTGQLVTALLRPGHVGDARGAPNVLERVIARLKALRPDLEIVVRGDANFATPRQYRTVEALDETADGVSYLLGISRNSVLEDKLEATMETAVDTYEATGQKTRKFVGFEYRAQSWDRPRYVVGKAEVGPKGKNPRFVIGDRDFREFPPEMIYRAYCERGESEQWVGAFKHQVHAQRLGCPEFVANFFRVILAVVAYRGMHRISQTLGEAADCLADELEDGEVDDQSDKRRTLARLRRLARADFETLRNRLLKVATIVEESTRRIHLQMPRTFPAQHAFRRLALQLERGPPNGG